METILIAGLDTVAGANIAASLSERYRVVGTAFDTPVSISGCETLQTAGGHRDQIRELLATWRPERVVYCGAPADSSWSDSAPVIGREELHQARAWAAASAESRLHLTFVSSDAVFTGPWLFHGEDSQSYSSDSFGRAIRQLERDVVEIHPNTINVRTNALGWSPTGNGWLEHLVDQIEAGQLPGVDPIPHATVIPATELGRVLDQAWRARLTGTWHIAGTERVSPAGFTVALSRGLRIDLLQLSSSAAGCQLEGDTVPRETSLRTGKIRRAVSCELPNVVQSVQCLVDQFRTGFRDRLQCAEDVSDRVA